MRPSEIPLTWQLWPSAGSCTPPALETIAHPYLQGPVHNMISCSNRFKSQGLLLYMLIKFSYPYIFGILVHRLGKPALSSSDVCVSRIESIKWLFGKDAIAKYDPSAPVIHGTLYFGIRGREHICILCRRTIQHRPRIGLLSRSRFWNPAGGGMIVRIPGYSSATPLFARIRRTLLHFKHNNHRAGFYHTSVTAFRP